MQNAIRGSPGVRQVTTQSGRYENPPHGGPGEFIAYAPRLVPGCLMLDVPLPNLDALDALQRIASERKETPIIVMSSHGSIPRGRVMRNMGADSLADLVRMALRLRIPLASTTPTLPSPSSRASHAIAALNDRRSQPMRIMPARSSWTNGSFISAEMQPRSH
jgi:DNA-binding NarL/FixJ family response regulator